jgi:hypothetical protein
MGPDWDGSKGDVNATETDSEPSEYAMGDKENKTKEDKVENNGAKKGTGRAKKGTAKPVKKKVGGDMEKEKKDAGDDTDKEKKNQKEKIRTTQRISPRLGQRSSARQAEAASAKGAREKRKSSGGENKGPAKKVKK